MAPCIGAWTSPPKGLDLASHTLCRRAAGTGLSLARLPLALQVSMALSSIGP